MLTGRAPQVLSTLISQGLRKGRPSARYVPVACLRLLDRGAPRGASHGQPIGTTTMGPVYPTSEIPPTPWVLRRRPAYALGWEAAVYS